jgi:hypothetical protein
MRSRDANPPPRSDVTQARATAGPFIRPHRCLEMIQTLLAFEGVRNIRRLAVTFKYHIPD